MELVLGTLWKDLLLAGALGGVGGIGLGLLQEKGLEMPHWHKETGVNFADLGFIADILIGAHSLRAQPAGRGFATGLFCYHCWYRRQRNSQGLCQGHGCQGAGQPG